ncbi:hypothetical protein N7456_000505 [Penicillium angulare]|uniref:3'-5' exonuclease domain-containing protein n=1 Tax=Penicillium angulare TaxID=116970 RepID=A0A9W9GC92_9EURO|nr:hypothetical protein N7456_000505 [Penicillium angulare]
MSAESHRTQISMIDTVSALLPIVTAVIRDRPLLYMHLEGEDFDRGRMLSVITFYIPSKNVIYLFDILILKERAFTAIDNDGNSLKTILESPSLTKVVFDIRHGSDTLAFCYQTFVKGIRNIQLMESGSRWSNRYVLARIGACVMRDSTIPVELQKEWGRVCDRGVKLFHPVCHGRRMIFNERPLPRDITKFLVAQVMVLPDLFNVYCMKLEGPDDAEWRERIEQATRYWLVLSQRPNTHHEEIKSYNAPWDRKFFRAVDVFAPEDGVDYGVSCEHDVPMDDEYGLECFEKVWKAIT